MVAKVTYANEAADEKPKGTPLSTRLSQIAVWSYIAVLAWAPFPLGGAVSWGAGLIELMIAACLFLWLAAHWTDPAMLLPAQPIIFVPLLIALLVLFWAFMQTLPIVPASWAHPVWSMTSDVLSRPVPAVVSLNPWRTDAELLKLGSSLIACWLAYTMSRRAETASLLLNAIIVIGAAYATYGFVLLFLGVAQAQLIYGLPFGALYVTGPFMLHNSFATYAGLATLAAISRLFASGSETIVAKRGFRQLGITVIQFGFGRGALWVTAALILFAGVVASASRGGFAATSIGLAAIASVSLILARRTSTRIWPVLGVVLAIAPMFVLLVANGDLLNGRVDQLLDEGNTDAIRLALWAAARHMIADAPWTGLGLGTFQDAYPLYATQVLPFIMDKAHCDYLEFAAGIGLPAAVAWWLTIGWLAFLCLRGVFVRRRDQLFAMTAIGATVLVVVHSSVDFSLQIPAVALSYAALLGIGVAQSARTAKS